VEQAVLMAERWVMAPLRNDLHVGLGALNAAIRRRLDELNDRQMRVLGKSRREMFEQLDKPALQTLPDRPFELGEWKRARVAIDYHVQFDKHYYSVPCELIHQDIEVRATLRTVEIFRQGIRVASHRRSSRKGGHTTLPEHMPDGHRRYAEWTPERIERWAKKTGPQTKLLVGAVMASREHPEQGFRSCLGIIRLADRYTAARLEAASRRALHFGMLSYKGVKNILDSGLDAIEIEHESGRSPVPVHGNVRGGEYYRAGGDGADPADS
jgi:transposase